MFGLTLVATLGQLTATLSCGLALHHRSSSFSSNSYGSRSGGCLPFRVRYRKVMQSEEDRQETVPLQVRASPVPPETTNEIAARFLNGKLPDHDAVRSATRVALEAMELDLGPTFDGEYFQQTLSTVMDEPHTGLSIKSAIVDKPRPDLPTRELKRKPVPPAQPKPASPIPIPSYPSSSGSISSVPFSPLPSTWQQVYKHIRSLRMSTEGPLQLVEHLKSGKQYIIKTIDECPEGFLPREAAMLTRALGPHTNIVHLEECFWEDEKCHMVIEYCSGGDLENLCNFCSVHGQRLPAEFILHFIAEMIEALAYLHNGNSELIPRSAEHGEPIVKTAVDHEPVIHRDIKPGNIFLRWDGTENKYGMPEVVLGDFGRSCTEADNQGSHGTRGFVAPEIQGAWDQMDEGIEFDPDESFNSIESDMYAFGATLFHLITLENYHEGDDIEKAWRKSSVKNWRFILNILQDCLATSPADRPDICELYEVPTNLKAHLQHWYRKGGRMGSGCWPDARWTQDMLEAADQLDQIEMQSSCSNEDLDGSNTSNAPTTLLLHESVDSLLGALSSVSSFQSNVATVSGDSGCGFTVSMYQFDVLNLFSHSQEGEAMYKTDQKAMKRTRSTGCLPQHASGLSINTQDSFVY